MALRRLVPACAAALLSGCAATPETLGHACFADRDIAVQLAHEGFAYIQARASEDGQALESRTTGFGLLINDHHPACAPGHAVQMRLWNRDGSNVSEERAAYFRSLWSETYLLFRSAHPEGQ
ncbi:MAG: hypothetical protein R3217_03810 [Gammaproteobacteria bacterium]|nr:hypothetical protein [Gammaproteobacteria bacterium]